MSREWFDLVEARGDSAGSLIDDKIGDPNPMTTCRFRNTSQFLNCLKRGSYNEVLECWGRERRGIAGIMGIVESR
jgi:hypothetical protein